MREMVAGLSDGNSMEATYRAELGTCVKSAHQAFAGLKVAVTGRHDHPHWALVDGRLRDSTPVRIRMEKVEELKVLVEFIAGTGRSEENQDTVRRMKEEFEMVMPGEGTDP
ncbi:MAG TPA: hypothetical protein VEN81_13340 [Planctomycetota bacterium]|nr:hypothetical protein [Planctomycetota bacterium]